MSPDADDQSPDDQILDDAATIVDDPLASRYELHVRGELAAFTNYRLEPNRIVFSHTETLDGFSGHGLATRLARGVLDAARTRGLRVVPQCPFVAQFVDEHPEYQDLVV
jgi:predicted GNAT family acetyltransferase